MNRRVEGRGEVAVRDAATIILVRRTGGTTRILMGLRGAGAIFMPDRFVFPGGAVDAEDIVVAAQLPLEADWGRLTVETAPEVVRALPLAAIRELWEETGLRLGRPDARAAALAAAAPEPWRGFLGDGLLPGASALNFVFRAVTPSGRPRRFDARFFLAEAADLASDPDDFTQASGELSHLQWLDLAEARALPLAFITDVVLAELGARPKETGAELPVPYFHHTQQGSHFRFL